jgi:hypothetical protein
MPTTHPLGTNTPLTLAPTAIAPTKSVDIVRAESELAAIDELMADLSVEFLADSSR